MKTRKQRRGAGLTVKNRHMRAGGESRPVTLHTQDEAFAQSSPFGPQSLFSLLLREREFLQKEIGRGRTLLGKWSDDAGSTGKQLTLLSANEAWPDVEKPLVFSEHVMQKFLTDWVTRLEQTLDSVTCQIAIQSGCQPVVEVEESVFELLRGAH